MLLCDRRDGRQHRSWAGSGRHNLCHCPRRQVPRGKHVPTETARNWYFGLFTSLAKQYAFAGYFHQDKDNSVTTSPLTTGSPLTTESPNTTVSPLTTLTVNVSVLERSGDWVLVQWNNVPTPNISDWVGLYTLPDVKEEDINVTAKAPVKFQVERMCQYIHNRHNTLLIIIRRDTIMGTKHQS